MNQASIIILLAVAGFAAVAIVRIINRGTARSSSNCTGCPLADGCSKNTNRRNRSN